MLCVVALYRERVSADLAFVHAIQMGNYGDLEQLVYVIVPLIKNLVELLTDRFVLEMETVFVEDAPVLQSIQWHRTVYHVTTHPLAMLCVLIITVA